MRACVSLLLTFVLASVGSQPPVAFSQPQTTTGGNPPCGCPQIPAIASSDKPDPRKSPHQLAFSDLEQWLSNREALYGGDWDKALLALAHEIDPTGIRRIWTRPVPVPSNRSVRITEGWYSAWLLGRGAPLISGAKARFIQDMTWALETIARSNKYGEPAFGLRKALLRSARFLSDDLANVAPPPPGQVATDRITTEAGRSRQFLWKALATAAALSQQNVDAARTEQARAQQAAAHHQLFLDAYDLANAALDVMVSVDDKQHQEGILDFPGGAIVFSHNGYGMDFNSFAVTKGVQDWHDELDALAELAGTRGVFGGPATAGSPAEAVACKAFSILVTLAGVRAMDGAQFREALFQTMNHWKPLGHPTTSSRLGSGLYSGGYSLTEGAIDSTYKAARAALIQAGTTGADDARGWAKSLYHFSNMFGSYMGSGDALYFTLMYEKPNPASADRLRRALSAELATMRDMERYVKGPGKAAFTAAVNEEFNKLSVEMQKDDAYYRAPKEQWISAWNAAASDYVPRDVETLCPPAAATPRIIIFAVGVNGRIMIKKLYVGVPTVLGVIFPEPYDGGEYPVKIRSGGGEISLTARPIDDQHLLFETEEFVITPK